ncbi:VirB4 family type IV secretion system protein [Haladaptatus sp. CMAA 1911]|uniref:VirB4 family type IV secretion system protein n=1 Tax=unclassified Haladaptatus TaxID=2622732 RepID=UPI003754624B
MTDDNNSGRRIGLETTIPQETTGSVFDLGLGLSLGELTIITVPTAALAYVELTYISVPLMWFFVSVGSVGGGLYYAVKRTPWYATPLETISKKFDYLRSRFRMPLVGPTAADVPGVTDVHPEYDALETDNGTMFTHVTVDLQNVSEHDRNDWILDAADLANGINKHIAQAESDGFDVKVHLPQTLPNDISQTDDLDEATFNDDLPQPAREYADSQAEHYIDWLAGSGVMDKTCTVVVWIEPHEVNTPTEDSGYLAHAADAIGVFGSGDATKAKQADALTNRVQTVQKALASVAGSRRLTTDESVSYLRRFWLDESTPFDFSDITTDAPVPTAAYVSNDRDDAEPVDDEEGGRLAAVREWVTQQTSSNAREQAIYGPAHIDEGVKTVDVNDHYTTSLWVVGWPSSPEPGFLTDALSVPGVRMDTALYVHATEYRDKMDELATDQEWLSAMGIEKGGKQAKSDDANVAATQKVILRDHMRDNGVEASEVSMVVTIRADSREQALKLRRKVKNEFLATNDIIATGADDRQLSAMKTAAPTPGDAFEDASHNDTRFEMPSDTLGAMFPMAGGYQTHESGTIYGMALARSGTPLGLLQVDRRSLAVPHRFWVGRSGSGKSFNIKDLIISDMLQTPNLRTIIVDIARGFDGVVETFDGSKVKVGETKINPFEVRAPGEHGDGFTADLSSKINLIADMFYLYLQKNASEPEELRATLTELIRKTFSEAGITDDPQTHSREKSPTMEDFFGVMADAATNPGGYTAEGTDYEVEKMKEHAGILLTALKPFKPTPDDEPDGAFEWMSGESEVDLSSRVLYFDMQKFEGKPAVEKGMALAYILSIAPEVAKQTENYVDVVVDEAHDLFAEAAQAGRLESMVRAGRNAGLMFDFISQADDDFNEDAAKRIAKQCAISGWQNMGKMGLSDPEPFGLSAIQASQLSGGLAAGDDNETSYSECLVDVDGDVYRVRKRVSDFAKAVLDYRESDDGDFDAYLARELGTDEEDVEDEEESEQDEPTEPQSYAPKPVIADD